MSRKSPLARKPNALSRRTFLKLMGGATAGLVAAGCAAPATVAPTSAPAPTAAPATAPAAQKSAPAVAVVKVEGYDRALVKTQVQAALEAIGGIADVVKPGAAVAVKVNLTGGVASNASAYGVSRQESYWTHPEVARALGELLLDAGAKTLYFVESVYDEGSYPQGGFTDIAKPLGATLINLNVPAPYPDFYTATVGKNWFIYESFPFNRVLENVDAFVSIPKMKIHYNAGVTVSMKNLVGIAPLSRFLVAPDDTYRHAFHNGPDGALDPKARLPRIIIDLNRARPINLALVDAISTVDVSEGPWIAGGMLRKPHVLIAGKSPVATDAVAAAVMGFDPSADYPESPFVRGDNHLNLARKMGLGTNLLAEIEVRGAPIDSVKQKFIVSPTI